MVKDTKGYELTKDGFNRWIDEYVSIPMFHKKDIIHVICI